MSRAAGRTHEISHFTVGGAMPFAGGLSPVTAAHLADSIGKGNALK
jgi:hypothetical protein